MPSTSSSIGPASPFARFNALEGKVPKKLARLTELEHLGLYGNNLDMVPEEVLSSKEVSVGEVVSAPRPEN